MSKIYFSVFSGDVYELNDKYTNVDNPGQLEITNQPKKNCKKCFGRGYTEKNLNTNHYTLCKCCLKDASPQFLHKASQYRIEDVKMHTNKSDF